MASRSWKAGSYLASAQSPKVKPSRPHFTRSSSISSTYSNHPAPSESNHLVSLSQCTSPPRPNSPDASFPGSAATAAASQVCGTLPNGTSTPFDVTPAKTRSRPITIERPARQSDRVYTPLSARGDLPGGYFPFGDTPIKPYRPHPFSSSYQLRKTSDSNFAPLSPINFSGYSNSSVFDSEEDELMTSDNTPRVNPTKPTMGKMSIPNPSVGKYHPSNYQLASPSPPTTSQGPTLGVMSIPMPPRTLQMPPEKRSQREPLSAGTHERRSSDVKRKLQQYQRDLVAQARIAQSRGAVSAEKKPDSPKLLPLGSPGPITPFELEDDDGGYLFARGHDAAREAYGNMDAEQRGSRSPSIRV